jgi:predicted nucleic acid-binding protein
MSVLFDTNVLVAAVTRDTDRSEAAIRVLNEVEDPHTSILNLMELRSVLAKKKAFERDRIDRIERRVAGKMTVQFPDTADIVAANQLQSETLLYPMDALILATAQSADCKLVSFDAELTDRRAVEPETLL